MSEYNEITREYFLEKIGVSNSTIFMLNNIPSFHQPEGAVTKGEYDIQDDNLIKRIVASYNVADKFFVNDKGVFWSEWLWNCKKEIHNLLLARDCNLLKYILRNPATNNLLYGFEGNAKLLLDKNLNKKINSFDEYDKILTLATVLGVVRAQYTEMFYSNIDRFIFPIDVNKLIYRISKLLNLPLNIFPNPFSGEKGIVTKFGIASIRAVYALYQAALINQVSQNFSIKEPKILEIGAGLGRTAFYTYQMGFKDYSIIDIPMTNVAHSYFLGRTLGENCIQLLGEEVHGHAIRILPSFYIDFIREDFDIILNVDSLTEMDENSQRTYMSFIENHTKIFISINHENNKYTVTELCKELKNIRYKERRIHPMRRGYIEDIIIFK